MWRTGTGGPRVGMGCMRLSTERDRDEARALAVLHAAFDAGITFLDTADAYCWDATEAGHNERLIARALATWNGDRSRILVATKGGLKRPQGGWVEDGRARHLVAACEASLRALNVDRLDLYQLHVPDPRTPLATSVRALDALKRDGRIGAIGLCNVNVAQIEEARRITDVAAIQVEMSIWQDGSLLNGVAGYCVANGIQIIAHRPVGGVKLKRRTLSDPVLADLAARHGASTFEIALAWLRDLSDLILPIPGPTRIETVQSIVRAGGISLSDDDRARLDERFPAGQALRWRERPPARLVPVQTDAEVVLIMGLPGAGKSTMAEALVAEGYQRLNRDDAGGSLKDLLPSLEGLIAAGSSRIVLDNTYLTRKSRAAVIMKARSLGAPVRCLWLSTSLEDAQVNAVSRMLSRYGRLLEPDEIRKAARRDVAAFGPTAQFRCQRELEPPTLSEGFSRVDEMAFGRRRDPSFTGRALILWCDGVLVRSRSGQRTPVSAGDVEVIEGRADVLRRYQAEGWRLLALSWQPAVADKTASAADVDAVFARMRELLGVSIEVEYCAHGAGPPACWCRKPLPGLGVVFIERHRLDPTQCIYVGAGPQDPGFARRLGFRYCEADDFFASAG
jgi:aryl-alcohol dehydrogenase-like predicted oxidoreductase/histidinol phosphatase-like enzyme/predicted kinase